MDDDFGRTLRRLRKRAGLTQEALAERSGLSVEGISALERGQRRHPRADTIDLLAAGLRLGPDGRRSLVEAAARALPDREHGECPSDQLYLDLRGHDMHAPLSTLRGLTFLVGSLGGDARDVPDDVGRAAAISRPLVSGSRVLILLDGGADAAQVERTLPADRADVEA